MPIKYPSNGTEAGEKSFCCRDPALPFSGSECLPSAINTELLRRCRFQLLWDFCPLRRHHHWLQSTGRKDHKRLKRSQMTVLTAFIFLQRTISSFSFFAFWWRSTLATRRKIPKSSLSFYSCSWQPTLPGNPSLIQIWMPCTVIWG